MGASPQVSRRSAELRRGRHHLPQVGKLRQGLPGDAESRDRVWFTVTSSPLPAQLRPQLAANTPIPLPKYGICRILLVPWGAQTPTPQ